jgi:DNA-binding MarR family transcriptional regulator
MQRIEASMALAGPELRNSFPVAVPAPSVPVTTEAVSGAELPPSLEVAGIVADSCGRLVRGFARVKATLLALAREDMDWSAHLLITKLAANGPMRSSALAELMHADPSTVSRQIAGLVSDGYVERRADPGDGRASLLLVTERGEQFYAEHLRMRNEHYQAMLADWTEAECRAFAALTDRFSAGIDRSRGSWFDRPGARPPSTGSAGSTVGSR